MIKRPSAKDTEEDLLRFQDEFLASLKKNGSAQQTATGPSATVYKSAATDKICGSTNSQVNNDEGKEFKDDDADDGAGDPAWFPSSKQNVVLGEIFERSFDLSKLKPIDQNNKTGFPVVESLTRDMTTASKIGGMSLFARQMLAKNKRQSDVATVTIEKSKEIDDKDEACISHDAQESTDLHVSAKLIAEIDAENQKRLTKMSMDEIAAERAELSTVLPPNLLDFLKNRKSVAFKNNGVDKKPTVRAQNESSSEQLSTSAKAEGVTAALPVKVDPRWLHMDNVENEKLEWTKDVPVGASATKELLAIETRFDFCGNVAIVPTSVDDMEKPATELPPSASGLYHHGEEPDRPGYTLSELLELARSSAAQQRVIALRTLAAICRNARSGKFVSCGLDRPVIPCLLEAGYPFVLRHALDDSTSEGNVLAALTAMHDLLVDQMDEHLLSSYTFACSWLSNNRKWPYFFETLMSAPLSDEEVKKMDDSKLMSTDVVVCLVFRTNLIARLRYILCDWSVGSVPISELILGILVRIACHSPACAQQIISGSSGMRLLDKIIGFLTSNLSDCSNEHELSLAKKSLRLLSAVAQSTPNGITSRFDPTRLNCYLPPDIRCSNSGVRISLATDALKLLKTFCLANIQSAKDLAVSLGQLFVEQETILLSKANKEQCPDAEILRYLCELFELFATLSQAKTATDAYDFDGIAYGLCEAVFVIFVDKITSWLKGSSASDKRHWLYLMLSSAYALIAACPNAFERMVVSEKFLALTENAVVVSLRGSVSHSTNSVVLMSISSLKSKQNNESPRSLQYLNAISSSSASVDFTPACDIAPWSLSAAIYNFLASSSLSFRQSNADLAKRCLKLPEICIYFKLIASKRSAVCFANSYFQLQFELAFLCAYASCLAAFASAFSETEDVEDLKTFYSIVFKMVPLLPGSFDRNLWRIVFDGFVFSPQILKHFGRDGTTLLASIQSVRGVYRDAMNILERGDQPFSFSQSAFCKDWLYFPLAAAGITVQVSSAASGEVEMPALRHRVVVSVLRYVRFAFRMLPAVVLQELTPLTHFVRLSSLYLNDDVFGGAAGELEGVRSLLAECLTALLQFTDQRSSTAALHFNEKVPGLDCTLPDFYIALLEQFKATSYGDVVFGNILLLFASSEQPLSFRRLLWGDHREVLTFLKIQPAQLLLNVDSFLQPFECNITMIKFYAEFVFNEIMSDHVPFTTPRSFLWIMAVNHLNAFLYDSTHRTGNMLRNSIWQAAVQQCTNAPEVRKKKLKDLVFYKYCPPSTNRTDEDVTNGMTLYETLPQNRQIFLRQIVGEKTYQSFILDLDVIRI